MFNHLHTRSEEKLNKYLTHQINILESLSAGSKDPDSIKLIKSWIREWEADTVWAHFGLGTHNVHHMRLRFYTGDIFPDDPQFTRDVAPIADLLDSVRPSVIKGQPSFYMVFFLKKKVSV